MLNAVRGWLGVPGGSSRKNPRGGALASGAVRVARRMASPFMTAAQWGSHSGSGGKAFNRYFGTGKGSLYREATAGLPAKGARTAASRASLSMATSQLNRRRYAGGAIGGVAALMGMGAMGGPVDSALTIGGAGLGYGLLAGSKGARLRGVGMARRGMGILGAVMGATMARNWTGAG